MKESWNCKTLITPRICKNILNWINSNYGQKIIIRMKELKINPYSNINKLDQNSWIKNKNFVITGSFSEPRNLIIEKIRRLSGKVSDSVSSKTNYLICGENPGSKLQKAISLNITILKEDEIYERLSKTK